MFNNLQVKSNSFLHSIVSLAVGFTLDTRQLDKYVPPLPSSAGEVAA